MTMPDPIGVSGPGPMSERIDKQPLRAPTGMPYGEAGALMQSQREAPLPQAAAPAPSKLSEGTERPGQPVTSGAALGPGPGPEALQPQGQGMPTGGVVAQVLARVAAADNSSVFARLYTIALSKGL